MSESECYESNECDRALDIAEKYDDTSRQELENSLGRPTHEERVDASIINFNRTAKEETEKRSFETVGANSFPHSINFSFYEFNDVISSSV